MNNVGDFMWKHLVADIEVVSKALGRNKEDVALFMHLLLKQMLSVERAGEQIVCLFSIVYDFQRLSYKIFFF